jgi:glycosyltransferase involved in cell wall biosynthesis
MRAWGVNKADKNIVINHGIDINEWPISRQNNGKILTMVNAFKQRDFFCGYTMYEELKNKYPIDLFGFGNQELGSRSTTSFDEAKFLKEEYSIYLNTSIRSPFPFSLVEAMASGMAIVSTKTCEIPNVIRHGVDGFLSNDTLEIGKYIELLLNDPALRKKIGKSARNRALEKFNSNVFIKNWNNALI